MTAIEYWYEHSGTVIRSDVLEILNMRINPVSRTPGTFKEECMSVATEFHTADPDLHLALSGGNESQVCLRSFISAGIKPNVVILQFPKQLNSADTTLAFETCKYLGIKPQILNLGADLDIRCVRELSLKYQTYSFTQTMMAHYLGKVGTNVILADKIDIKRDVHPKIKWCLVRSEDSHMWSLRYNQLNKNKIISDFFTHAPEQLLSFLQIGTVEQLMHQPGTGKISLNSLKNKIYREAGFTQLKFYNKTNTVDNISGLNSRANLVIDDELKFRPRRMYIEYQELLQALTNEGTTCQYI